MREGWKYDVLSELVTVINGLWKGKKGPFINVGVIRNANFNKDITLNYSNIEYLDVEERQYKTRKLLSGDLIVEKSGGSEKQPVGRTVLFRGEGEFSVSNFTSILRIKDQNVIIPEFLYKYLLFVYYSGATKVMQKATTGIHNILFDKFLAIQIPIPSIVEQERIVSLLDLEFAKIDAIKANAEKQLQDAKDLFQSVLKDLLTPKEGWEKGCIGDIADIRGGKRVPKGYKFESEPTKHIYIRVSNFNNLGSIDTSELMYISDEVYEQIKRYIITDEDVYISIAGTIGKAGIIPSELNGANLTENACRLVLNGKVYKRFVYYYTLLNSFKERLKQLTKTGSQPKLAITRLATAEITYPDIEEQKEIVKLLDLIIIKLDKLQSNYEQTIILCNDLKQSILKDIFG